jgi:hypothetical protein
MWWICAGIGGGFLQEYVAGFTGIRTMAFIVNGIPEEIPIYDPRKIEAYIDRYLPFHAQFAAMDGRAVDKALWAFGKFLSEVNFPVRVPNEPH